MVADVPARVSSGPHHEWQICDLPEEYALENELHIVLGATIELEIHVLSAAVKALDAEIALLTSAPPAPTQAHYLCVWRQEEGARLRSGLLTTTVFEIEIAILVLDDHGFVLRQSQQ